MRSGLEGRGVKADAVYLAWNSGRSWAKDDYDLLACQATVGDLHKAGKDPVVHTTIRAQMKSRIQSIVPGFYYFTLIQFHLVGPFDCRNWAP